VLEPLRGYLILAERLAADSAAAASGWNFGPAMGDARPVEWIADRLVRAWGTPAAWERDTADHPHEAHFLRLDTSKAAAELGWQPALPLDAALDWIVEWYQASRAGDDLRAATERQLTRYESLGRA
jgi:CDP-glucose 4,6-dehydratase